MIEWLGKLEEVVSFLVVGIEETTVRAGWRLMVDLCATRLAMTPYTLELQ